MATAAIDGMGKLFDFMALPRTHAGKVRVHLVYNCKGINFNFNLLFRREYLKGCCAYWYAGTLKARHLVHEFLRLPNRSTLC
jgi:hypothetical protein